MEPTPEALVERARGGDAEAVDELFRRVYPVVQETVHRRLEHDFRKRHPWMAPVFSTADIVQDTFLGVLRDLDSFRESGPDSFVRWCVRQVRNRILDSLRHHEANRRDRRREQRPPERAHEPERPGLSPVRLTELRESVLGLYRAIRCLPLRDRRLVVRRLIRGEPYSELVAALGLGSEENARARFRRAKVQLLMHARRMKIELTAIEALEARRGEAR
jgi:RNA polymerase sigma factor (sigma-70 family)